ncbi:peptide deformylase [Legionella sp. CNM-4043-24]|uniref:peptide deformylase n=1 Tax=Legionella sp. CNM-4043-24 TaxID=3421646 RepID=UPI00403AC69E
MIEQLEMQKLLEKDNPLLKEKAALVLESEFGSSWLRELADNLLRIMKEKCAVGVAAPQIGVQKRVIVFGTSYTKSRKIEEPVPDTVLINPSLKALSDEIQIGYEGCLNCGDLRAEVPRSLDIEYSGYDLAGRFFSKRASGLEARILQHEIDHLDGLLFTDRVQDESTYTTAAELQSRV